MSTSRTRGLRLLVRGVSRRRVHAINAWRRPARDRAAALDRRQRASRGFGTPRAPVRRTLAPAGAHWRGFLAERRARARCDAPRGTAAAGDRSTAAWTRVVRRDGCVERQQDGYLSRGHAWGGATGDKCCQTSFVASLVIISCSPTRPDGRSLNKIHEPGAVDRVFGMHTSFLLAC